MQKFRVLFVFILLIFNVLLYSQNNTNSPYTRFGFGEVSDNASGVNRAMGAAAIGFRSPKVINTVNPAAYSAVDSLSFMFDVGLTAFYSHFSAPNGSNGKLNGNLEYITMQFPLTRYAGVSAGLLPYSFTGYNFSNSDSLDLGSERMGVTDAYSGSGAVSQVYLGAGVKFLKHFSLGANAYYMFGTMNNSRIVSYSATSGSYQSTGQLNNMKVSSFRFRYGAQYFTVFDKKYALTLGAYYENKMPFGAKVETITAGQVADTVTLSGENFQMPQAFGVGASCTLGNKWTLNADFSFQQWNKAKFYGKTDTLANRMKIALGAEYIPKPNGTKFAHFIHYRAGLALSDSYYNVRGTTLPKNIIATAGVGLPMPKSRSMLNIALEYGKIGNSSLMREDYLKLTVSATINEYWFVKRKL